MGRSALDGVPNSGIDINAPAAPSGTGYFREAFPTDSGSVNPFSPAFRKGPANALWVDQASITPVSAGGTKAKIQKPPKTKPSIKSVRKENTTQNDIDIKVKVFADRTSTKVAKYTAKTPISFKNIRYNFPSISCDKKSKITKVKTKFEFKGVISIQTLYGSKAKATDKSLYGRGTTKADKLAGNITLGFHESCHRDDFFAYLKNNPLPTFTIKVGDTFQQYSDAKNKFETAYKKYIKDMRKKSDNNTDEVGYKLSKCIADRKCK